jgi:hypothetical protein
MRKLLTFLIAFASIAFLSLLASARSGPDSNYNISVSGGGGGAITTLFGPHTFSGTDFAPGSQGVSHRGAVKLLVGCGTQIRVTVHGGFSTGTIYDHVSIGIGNGTFNNTTATPTEVLWSGGHGITVAAGASSAPSDWTTFSCTSANTLIGIVDINASGGNVDADSGATDATGAAIFSVTASGGTYNQTTVGAGTGTNNELWGISKIETQ